MLLTIILCKKVIKANVVDRVCFKLCTLVCTLPIIVNNDKRLETDRLEQFETYLVLKVLPIFSFMSAMCEVAYTYMILYTDMEV
jgi:hypothetical protein